MTRELALFAPSCCFLVRALLLPYREAFWVLMYRIPAVLSGEEEHCLIHDCSQFLHVLAFAVN